MWMSAERVKPESCGAIARLVQAQQRPAQQRWLQRAPWNVAKFVIGLNAKLLNNLALRAHTMPYWKSQELKIKHCQANLAGLLHINLQNWNKIINVKI